MAIHEPPWDPHRVPGKPLEVEERKDEDLRDFFETFDMVLGHAREMLIEEVFTANLQRPHHLATATAAMQDAVLLDKARAIVLELYLGEHEDEDTHVGRDPRD